MNRHRVAAGCVAILVAAAFARSAGQERRSDVLSDVPGLLAAGLYERAEAAARSELDTLRAAHGDDSLEVAQASDLLVRARIVNGRAAQDETLELARRTLRIKEAHLGADHPDLVTSLLNLGDVLAAEARFEEAIAITSRAVVLRERTGGSDSLGVAESLDHLGSTLSQARRDDDALKALERSLRIKEAALEGKDVSIARTLEAVALVLQNKGAYERAGPAIRRAAAIQEAVSTAHPAYADTLDSIAQQLWFEGRLIESKDASERAVAVAERALRPDHPTLALSLRRLGSTLEDLGDLGQSLARKERALAIAERNYPRDHHELAGYLYSVAYAGLVAGDFVTARQRFQRALSIYETRYGPSHDFVASTLSQLARVDASLGDYATARREQSRAVAIHERVGGPTHPYVAYALMDLASVYRDAGSPRQALPLLTRALAIREKSLGPDHRDVAWTLADLASTLTQIGETAQAQTAATRAVDIWARLDLPDAPEHATVLALYAELQTRRGNNATAREYYERAMAIRAKVFGTSNPDYASAQAGLALTLASLGETAAAVRNAAGAESTGRAHLRMMLRSLPERQSLNYAAVRPKALDLMLSLSASSPEFAGTAMDGVIRSRALVLDEMAVRHRSERAAFESTDSNRVAFASAQQRLANLAVRGPGQLPPAQYTALLDAARRDGELAEQALAERSAEFRAERSRAQLGLDDIRASLPADAALVSFVRYNRTVFTARRTTRTVPSYLALVTRAHKPPAVVPLGSVQNIESRVSQWRADIAGEAGTVPATAASAVAAGRSSRDSGLLLRRLVWDPMAPHISDTSRVFIVPDGALSLVPFGALPVGQRSYVLERGPVLHYLSAERDLVPTAGETGAAGQGLLAFGGPAYDDASLFGTRQGRPDSGAQSFSPPRTTVRAAASICDDVQAIRFPALKGTLQEVREVSGVWSGSRSVIANEASRVLVGRDASEQALKKNAHRYRVLHFATHGFFLGDSCPPAPAGTRAVGGLVIAPSARSEAPKPDNPLLLSGLALAGANRRQAASLDEDDGILTAEEVVALDFDGVEWAVLSACNTGLGEIRSGEGVFGLRRAFQIAGARTVIMSLWSVEDNATRLWMRGLYEARLTRMRNTADAMREASLSVLRARRAAGQSTSPFFWAAFVAAGDWR